MLLSDLSSASPIVLEQLAALSVAAARLHAPRWLPDRTAAENELRDAMNAGGIAKVAFIDGQPAGWTACRPLYSAVWELHPLLVAVDHHGKGVGAALVQAVEQHVRSRNGGVIVLSTSDEIGATSLFGVDLYNEPLRALSGMTYQPGHAVGFWLRMGYTLVGVTPDAEGPGMPSIHFSKRP